MQANEMKFNFMLKYDSLFEFAAPAYDDRQISWLLTSAQSRVFLDKYYTPSNKYGLGFEADEKRRRDLEQLIKSATWTSPNTSVNGLTKTASQTDADAIGKHPNGTLFDLPTDFVYAIEEAVITDAIAGKEVLVRPITHDQYLANVNNPYKQPYANLVWRMDYSRLVDADGDPAVGGAAASAKRTELITAPGATVTKYRLRYLRMPPDIVVDEFDPTNQKHCVLDETLHETIIDEAVKIAKAAVKPQEYQVADKEKADGDD
jgi:hypothetical protein